MRILRNIKENLRPDKKTPGRDWNIEPAEREAAVLITRWLIFGSNCFKRNDMYTRQPKNVCETGVETKH